MEKWIHRECARDEEEMVGQIVPTSEKAKHDGAGHALVDAVEVPVYTMKKGDCERCGEFGLVYLYEVVEVVEIKIGDFSLEKGEVGGSNPEFKGVPDEIVKEMGKVIDEIQSEDAEIPEEVVPAAEPTVDGESEPEIPEEAPVEETNVTVSKEEQIRAQIAELEAQLEKEE